MIHQLIFFLQQQVVLEAPLRHRRHFFPGKGILWIFILFFLFGEIGKSGFPGFILPVVIIWFVFSMLSGVLPKSRMRWEPPAQPRQDRPVQQPPAVRPAVREAPRPAPARSMAGIPSRCKACGGPANETTVEWAGIKAQCGFCGTGF